MTRPHTEPEARERKRGFLARLASDDRGGLTTILAVAAVPLIGMAGIGVDVARALSARNDLQAATDNSALALARQPNGSLSGPQLQTQAKNWVLTNYTRTDISNLVVTPTSSAAQVTVAATADVTTTLAGILGVRTLHLSVTSLVKRNVSHIELALVLDNTYSMYSDNKIGTLKNAANDLVNTLTQSAVGSGQPGSLKIAVVPFASAVNVGTQYANAAWMSRVSPYSSSSEAYVNDPALGNDRLNVFSILGQTRSDWNWDGCVEDRPMPYDVLDAAPNSSIGSSMFTPYFAPDEPDDSIAAANNYSGQGYLGWSNSYLKDSDNDGTDYWTHYSDTNKYYPLTQDTHSPNPYTYSNTNSRATWQQLGQSPLGPNFGCGTQPVLRLQTINATSDANPVTTEINAMTPYGATFIPIGLIWGWHVLSPNTPFADGAAYNTPNTTKIIVLVTDGTNTYQQNGQEFDHADLPGYRWSSANLTSTYSSIGYAGVNNSTVVNGNTHLFKARIAVNGPTAVGQSAAAADYNQGVKAAMDDRLAKLCTNIKNANPNNPIIVYTVPVEVSDAPTKQLLQNCATDGNHYIDASSTAALTAAFQNIAGQISALRIAQ